MASTPFRFLDLPPELRNSIYHLVLCTLSPPEPRLTRVHQDLESYTSFVPLLEHYKFDTAILLVNRQISHEAIDVMLKYHLFIRVVTHGVNLCHLLSAWEIPIVAIGKAIIRNFKGFVMSYSIKIRDASPAPKNHMILLQKDFALFCEALNWLEPSPESFDHRAVLYNPFRNTTSSNYLGITKQTLLVQPYREYLAGIPFFKLEGNICRILARDVTKQVKKDPQLEPWPLLEALNRVKLYGDDLFLQGEYIKALKTWKKSTMQMIGLAGSPLWQRIKAIGDPSDAFPYHIAEIVFYLHMNQVAGLIIIMEILKNQGSLEQAREYWPILLETLSGSFFAVEKLETDWEPLPIHIGERFFRLATAYRILESNSGVAHDCIKIAGLYLPGNQDIQAEEARIDEWIAKDGT
ncbi:hypothetical protein F4813DRAFT_388011 [Daldinia decipiens]|uniref:uncharacterized protein n=1 Tax=Daldinia decipiens TaxID=326647 RepID=UPI0020C26D34|nr:uncharacterized protein F4813DRAFT_388011 [Daldinia decipiens]KAI1659304.1 hypothetical protein F4813DRAFT_388011 [Daldinia decipiens]